MPSLVAPADVRALVTTDLGDTDLQAVIDREEAELIRRFGAHADGVTPLTETYTITGADVYASRPVVSLTSVSIVAYVGAASSTLVTSQYILVPPFNQIRIAPFLREAFVTIVYVPKDDRPVRAQVLIELVRLAVEQNAMKREGDITSMVIAPDWWQVREDLYRRVVLLPVV